MPPSTSKTIIGCEPIRITETDCVVQVATDANTIGTCNGAGVSLIEPKNPDPGEHVVVKRLAVKRPLKFVQNDGCTVGLGSDASVVKNCQDEGEPLVNGAGTTDVEIKRLRAGGESNGTILDSEDCNINIRSQMACTLVYEECQESSDPPESVPLLNPENPGPGEKFNVRQIAVGAGLQLDYNDNHICIRQTGRGGELPSAGCEHDYLYGLTDGSWAAGSSDGNQVHIGCNSDANLAGVAIGYNSKAVGGNTSNVAVGPEAQATGGESVAVGHDTRATGITSIAIGKGAKATKESGIAIGTAAEASGVQAVAIGEDVKMHGANNIAIGRNLRDATSSLATKKNLTLIGHDLPNNPSDLTEDDVPQTFMRTFRTDNAPGYITQLPSQELVFVEQIPAADTVTFEKLTYEPNLVAVDNTREGTALTTTLKSGVYSYVERDGDKLWTWFTVNIQWTGLTQDVVVDPDNSVAITLPLDIGFVGYTSSVMTQGEFLTAPLGARFVAGENKMFLTKFVDGQIVDLVVSDLPENAGLIVSGHYCPRN